MMEQMQRVSGPGRRAAILHVAVALLIQFAPSIHVFGAHRHDSSTCNHGTPRIHFEAAASGANDAPCLVCAQLLTRQALADVVGLEFETVPTIAENLPPFTLHPWQPALELPDNRGPPNTL